MCKCDPQRRKEQMPEEEQGNKRSPAPGSITTKKSKPALSASPSRPGHAVVVKQEPEQGDVSHGGRASRARARAAVAEQATPAVKLVLHCAVAECNRPLKPPIFKCEAGHRLCGACCGDGGQGHCRRCGCDTAFVHCGPDLDEFVDDATVSCHFKAFGCGAAVAYHDAAAHGAACAYAPCTCAVAACAFAASPPVLRAHLADVHSWWLHALPGYGKPLTLRVLASESHPQHHRLLAVPGDELRLFVLSVRALPGGGGGGGGGGAASCWAVSVACVRGSGAAEAGPRYACKLWAQAPAAPGMPAGAERLVMMEAEVASCEAPGGDAVPEGMTLLVPPQMLTGASSKMIHLRVRIDEVNADPAPAASWLPAQAC